MSTEFIVGTWREVRNGLISEAELIPPDKYAFRATDQTRSVAEVLQHIIESQKLLVGEASRADTNLKRASFPDLIKLYAPDVSAVSDKDGLIDLLRGSMDHAETALRAAGDELNKTMNRFDGKEILKSDFVRFAIAHEMYHRGQLTVYERLLEIEPAMTKVFKRIFASPSPAAGSSAT